MNKMLKSFILLCLFSATAIAQNLSTSFPAGSGASYKVKMKKDPTPILLSIYVAGTRVDSVHIEYHMETEGILPLQLWQQFEIGISPRGGEIKKGFIFADGLSNPEIIPAEYLKGASGGIQLNDFVFLNKEQLLKDKIGDEIVEIAAGTTKTVHYRTGRNGQTIDYWISDEAKPMGLVMLISKSEEIESQNYSLELTSIIKNIKAKIVPEKAIPISAKGKTYLAKPESLR